MPKKFIQKYNIPLFISLSDHDLDRIVEKLQVQAYEPGQRIIYEGDQGDCLFLIKKGKVNVIASLVETDEEINLSTLETGDYFGEMALITGGPRSASVVAEEPTEVWKLFKTDFEELLLTYPDITLTLTHRLSERLYNSNKARQEAERYYKDKFIPRGELGEIGIIALLKYIEENSLTGHLQLKHHDDTARFLFKKGQLVDIEYKGMDEPEAIDEIIKWEDGEFMIEPELISFKKTDHSDDDGEMVNESSEVQEEIETRIQNDSKTAGETADVTEPEKEFTVQKLFKTYLTEKFSEFNQFSGLQITQNALRQSYHKFKDYFDVIEDIKIDASSEPDIQINTKNWTEKHTLVAAILLRDLVNSIGRDVVGIEFWTPNSRNPSINTKLEEISFFEYFDQATDFIRI